MILVWSQIQQSRLRHSWKRLKKLPSQWDYIWLPVRPNECMFFNKVRSADIQTLDDSNLEVANDLKYLGSWIGSSEHDIQVRKALAWKTCNALSKIWKSSLSRCINECLFQAIVESILLYGAESWPMTNKIQKQLDGYYTRVVRAAFNISWKDKKTNQELYGDLPHLSQKTNEQ